VSEIFMFVKPAWIELLAEKCNLSLSVYRFSGLVGVNPIKENSS